MSLYENTSPAALTAAGFRKVVDYGRMELWTGTDIPGGSSVMKLFDNQTNVALEVGGIDNPMKLEAKLIVLGLILRELINRNELALPAGVKTAATNMINTILQA